MWKKNDTLLFILTFVAIIIFTPLFGSLYELFLGPINSSFWGPSHPEYIEGFFVSYAFFVTFFISIFGSSNKNKQIITLLGVIFLIEAWLGDVEAFIVNLGVAIVGYLLAQLILLIYKQIKKA